MSEAEYSEGRNSGFYGGPVPDISSSEAMRCSHSVYFPVLFE